MWLLLLFTIPIVLAYPHTHTHRDKLIAVSAPPYYVVGADTAITLSGCVCVCGYVGMRVVLWVSYVSKIERIPLITMT